MLCYTACNRKSIFKPLTSDYYPFLYFNSFIIFYGPFSDHCSAHVKVSKIVLYSGFHAVDSGLQVVDSSFCRWNLDSLGGIWIPLANISQILEFGLS